jgi:hypothetical protein
VTRDAPPLYGPNQSAFARYLERREQRKPDTVSRELRRKLLAGMRGRVIEIGCGDGARSSSTRRVSSTCSPSSPTRSHGL